MRRFVDSLASYVTDWLSDRPGFQVGYKILWTMSLFCDIATQAVTEGLRAAWPGKDSRTDNTAALAYNRGLIQGETETIPAFQARLRDWLTLWETCGSDLSLAMRIHEYVAGNPMVRVITRSGRFTTVNPDGTVSVTQGTWNWDGSVTPLRTNAWWDCWIVIYPTLAGYYAEDVGIWSDSGSGLASSTDLGWDHACTRVEVDALLALVKTWKGAHVNVRTIIWSKSADYYAPTPISGSPDGTWGKWFNQSTNVPTRNQIDAFWDIGVEYS